MTETTQPDTPREWLALSMLPRVGARRLMVLRQAAPVWPEGWLARLPEEAAQMLRYYLQMPEQGALHDRVKTAMAWLEHDAQHHLLTPDHPAWPAMLDELPDPPPVLWAWGALKALSPPALAVVGTRRPTREGQDNAWRLARDMAGAGYCVVSGLALGVDGCAHHGALEARGATIAVLGCGVDVLYPRTHARLRQQLLAGGGLLLSEHPPGTRAHPQHFPRRNRIITGLSLGVLVVEAAMASGSLVSARLAMEQNREVFALPGSLHNPQARGCLWLIREGARLVTCLEEIVQELPERQWGRAVLEPVRASLASDTPDPSSSVAVPSIAASPVPSDQRPEDPLWEWLADTPVPVDELVERTGDSIAALQSRLLMLELDGWAAQVAGGWVRRLA
ncbi:DNA-processing protein DprA [Kushneria indalinina]|uniref:DNA processing protein n=1 Tax=Kushneria indalinina DSM 14324 TaxID=1122140 RepID=A0A3D9DS92_9GAMM|nr:DNA-processing protein DprA [Kushneria indalinina]REC93525.1 DNA processing protein [Kushneria indalinina DSM 14324]